METEFQNATGKGVGEVVRDVREFLSLSCIVHPERQLDLCTLLPDLNMYGQFSFALLSEAYAQGWEPDAAESFYRHATAGIDEELASTMIAAFRDQSSEAYRTLCRKYGNRFTLSDGSYWSSCLALGIDAGEIGKVMQYLRLFTVTLMEFAYMEDRNPEKTYTWSYYESFRRMLDELTAEPEAEPLPLKIRALGGSAGKRDGDGYMLSLGVDIENPNPDRMARSVGIDITLKDRNGNIITVIKDQLQSIDPATIYHFGVTKRIKGAAVASLSATAKPASYFKLSTPIMRHLKLNAPRVARAENATKLIGNLQSAYDRPLHSVILHYQYLNADNKILGGGSEWIFDEIAPTQPLKISSTVSVPLPAATKILYSVDFDALELVKD